MAFNFKKKKKKSNSNKATKQQQIPIRIFLGFHCPVPSSEEALPSVAQ
jgi:hypothetical protein